MKIFIEVAEVGKMREVAQKLYISQPTISQAISEIEREYNILLFERLNKKLYITDDGKLLLEYVRHITKHFDEMEENLKGLSKNKILRIGATITVATCLLDTFSSKFENSYPEIKLNVFVDNTHIIENMLLSSELDVALVEGEIKSSNIVITPIIEDELVLVCGKGHMFAKKMVLTVEELQGLDFIMREKGSGTRALFERELNKKDVSVNIKWTCNNSEAIKNAVIANQGIAVISKRLIFNELKSKKLILLKVDDMVLGRKFNLVYHKNKYISLYLKQFIDYCINNN